MEKNKINTYIDIKKINGLPHVISQARKIRNVPPFTINNELVLIDPRWKDQQDGVIFARLL